MSVSWVILDKYFDEIEVELLEIGDGSVHLTVYDSEKDPGTTLSAVADISSVEKIDQLILHLQEAKKALIKHRESRSNG